MHAARVYNHIMRLVRLRNHVMRLGDEDSTPMDIETLRDGKECTHILCSRSACATVLGDDSFVPSPIADAVSSVGKRFDIDVSAVEGYLRFNPLQMSGPEHKLRRKRFLEHHNGICKQFSATFENLANSHFLRFASTLPSRVSNEMVKPYVDDVFRMILAACDPRGGEFFDRIAGHSSPIFEYVHHPRRLGTKSVQAGECLAGFIQWGEGSPEERRERGYILLTYILQGRDPLIGGLAAFAHDLLACDDAERQERIQYTMPKTLFCLSSPVNYIGRVATRSCAINGVAIEPSDRIILMLPWANVTKSDTTSSMAFGAGVHVCAGQALALAIADAWLTGLRRHQYLIDWHAIKPDRVIPAVFRYYETTE